MADTTRYPVATRVVIMFMAIFHLLLMILHLITNGASGSNRRETAITWVYYYLILIAISYFVQFREIEYRYDDPASDEYNGQWMQDLRTARTVIQLFAQAILFGIISLITSERVAAFSRSKSSRFYAKCLEALYIAAIFVLGLTRVSLTSWSYSAFYRGHISWEDYQHRLAIAKQIGIGWILSNAIFTFNLIMRTSTHLLNSRSNGSDDPVSRYLLFLVSPLLGLYVLTLVLINVLLPKYLGLTIGEITGSSVTLAAINDPTLTFSNLEFLEAVEHLVVVWDRFFLILAVIWLLSDAARRHWEVRALDSA